MAKKHRPVAMYFILHNITRRRTTAPERTVMAFRILGLRPPVVRGLPSVADTAEVEGELEVVQLAIEDVEVGVEHGVAVAQTDGRALAEPELRFDAGGVEVVLP